MGNLEQELNELKDLKEAKRFMVDFQNMGYFKLDMDEIEALEIIRSNSWKAEFLKNFESQLNSLKPLYDQINNFSNLIKERTA